MDAQALAADRSPETDTVKCVVNDTFTSETVGQLSLAIDAHEAGPVLSAAASEALCSTLTQEFQGRRCADLEEECRLLVKQTALACLELGKRLLVLKEVTRHGEWLPTLERIGIDKGVAQRMASAAIRFLSIPGGLELVKASGRKSKLLELLALNDGELSQVAEGGEVCGITMAALPDMTVKVVRDSVRRSKGGRDLGETPQGAALPPSSQPLLGDDLWVGARVRSKLVGRLGKVVKVYADSSASVCWDDGEPQAAGLGHERMPRFMLELCPDGAAVEGGDDQAGAGEGAAKEELPVADSLVHREWIGIAIGVAYFGGKAWVSERHAIAALLAFGGGAEEDYQQASGMIWGHIEAGIEKGQPQGAYVTLLPPHNPALTAPEPVRCLDYRALKYLGVMLDGAKSHGAFHLSDWLLGAEAPRSPGVTAFGGFDPRAPLIGEDRHDPAEAIAKHAQALDLSHSGAYLVLSEARSMVKTLILAMGSNGTEFGMEVSEMEDVLGVVYRTLGEADSHLEKIEDGITALKREVCHA